jgi:hypothetical protein
MSKIIFEKLTIMEKEQVNGGNNYPEMNIGECAISISLLPSCKCISENPNGAS